MATGKLGIELLQSLLAQKVKAGGIHGLLKNVKITYAENGIMKATMIVGKEHGNLGGTLHGGMTAFLVDTLSGAALATYPGVKNIGVSLDLSVTFMKAAPIGKEIEIISRTDRAGSKIAFLSVDVLDKKTGDLLAKGSHVKYIGMNSPGTDVKALLTPKD